MQVIQQHYRFQDSHEGYRRRLRDYLQRLGAIASFAVKKAGVKLGSFHSSSFDAPRFSHSVVRWVRVGTLGKRVERFSLGDENVTCDIWERKLNNSLGKQVESRRLKYYFKFLIIICLLLFEVLNIHRGHYAVNFRNMFVHINFFLLRGRGKERLGRRADHGVCCAVFLQCPDVLHQNKMADARDFIFFEWRGKSDRRRQLVCKRRRNPSLGVKQQQQKKTVSLGHVISIFIKWLFII